MYTIHYKIYKIIKKLRAGHYEIFTASRTANILLSTFQINFKKYEELLLYIKSIWLKNKIYLYF